MDILNGLQIIENKLLPQSIPKKILSHKVKVSDNFRKKYNLFLQEFFGTDIFYYVLNNKIYLHPAVAAGLKSYIVKNYKHIYKP